MLSEKIISWIRDIYLIADDLGLRIIKFGDNFDQFSGIEFIFSPEYTANKIIAEYDKNSKLYLQSKAFIREKLKIGTLRFVDSNSLILKKNQVIVNDLEFTYKNQLTIYFSSLFLVIRNNNKTRGYRKNSMFKL